MHGNDAPGDDLNTTRASDFDYASSDCQNFNSQTHLRKQSADHPIPRSDPGEIRTAQGQRAFLFEEQMFLKFYTF